MTARRIAAVLGALAVVLGAFGAHTLKDRLDPVQLDWWQKATLYHLVHAAVILASGRKSTLASDGAEDRASAATWSLVAGIVIFSGSLYAMALGAPRWFGAITPIGGLAFIAGWLLLLRRS